MKQNIHHSVSAYDQSYTSSSSSCCCCCCQCHCCYQHIEDDCSISIPEENQQSISPWQVHSSSRSGTDQSSSSSYCSCSASLIEPDSHIKHNTDAHSVSSTDNSTPSEDFERFEDDEFEARDADRLQRKKKHAIEELLQTEKVYVRDLSFLVQVCLKALSRQEWIPQQDRSMIMRNSSQILSFHKELMSSFNTTASNNENHSFIVNAFLDQIAHFSLYKQYCDLHAEAWTLTSEYRSRPEWADFLKECSIIQTQLSLVSTTLNLFNRQGEQKQSYYEQQKKLHFEDYLIKPVQRICRYQLLIKEIMKYIPPRCTEYNLWKTLLDKMHEIVTEIDELKYQRELKERTDRFIQRLSGDWRLTKNHVAELGNIILAGAIEVTYSAIGQTFSKPKYLGCFIFSTYMIMVKPKKVTYYEPKYWFPLCSATFENLEDIEGQREHSFVVRCKKHAFIFTATCSHEKQLWTKKLTQVISECKVMELNNTDAGNTIISSLPGISAGSTPQKIRISKSFTDLLDKTMAGVSLTVNDTSNETVICRKDAREVASPLKRSLSSYVRFDDSSTKSLTALPAGGYSRQSSAQVSLKKRYSVDYHPSTVHKRPDNFALKPRNNSELYIKPDLVGSGRIQRRPSSLDLLSLTATNTTNLMIGKIPWKTKSNYQFSLRLIIDHKLRDVCTQEYLSSKAWYFKDRELSLEPPATPQSYVNNCSATSASNLPGVTNEPLKKCKSSSFIRTSASSFSLMMHKRAIDSKPSNSRAHHISVTDFEDQSCISSAYSSTENKMGAQVQADKDSYCNISSGTNTTFEKQQLKTKCFNNRPVITSHASLTGTPQPSGSDDTLMNSDILNRSYNVSYTESNTPKSKLFVGKVLHRLSSFHRKSMTPLSFESQIFFKDENADSTLLKSKKCGLKGNSQEYLSRPKISDRPKSFASDPNEGVFDQSSKAFSRFSFTNGPSSTNTKEKSKKETKWRNRFSSLRATTFFRMRNSGSQPLNY
ncbi:hypothetical protein BDF20DRAFT_909527 [Mycotypha africana]|uniref:uncharacterized protein n=1 Tax=Mycotypha africana TaxID=64632 RepID=UPI0023018E07|nr:uncharacterized protein BDF20DRAFT_909527 [Mycotypha africana]KAI8991797.1 hypothetical protein BDF20DRAFT_909527 [Mycotypha africana]